MKKYIIDGNNLVGKIKSVANIQKRDKQESREKIAHLIDRFFTNKKNVVFLHFDGFENRNITVDKVKIIYSENVTADEKIKKQIEGEKNNRNTIVVSSDNGIKNFAKVCSCEIILSEDFGKEITKIKYHDDEETRIKEINDIETFKKIFNV
jgi:predicted RNA-binding protein with PIN domain